MPENNFKNSVFINCPFGPKYKNIRDAIIFILVYCDLEPKIASGSYDAFEIRLTKIQNLIRESKYSIHDISRMKADKKGDYARFNMPFELGIDYGFKIYGGEEASENKSLIFSTEPYDFPKALSDLSGIDIKSHKDEPENVVRGLRNWIRNTLNKTSIPSGNTLWADYLVFLGDFKEIMEEENFDKIDQDQMEPNEYIHYINKWKAGR